jgi:hypothetical protein
MRRHSQGASKDLSQRAFHRRSLGKRLISRQNEGLVLRRGFQIKAGETRKQFTSYETSVESLNGFG